LYQPMGVEENNQVVWIATINGRGVKSICQPMGEEENNQVVWIATINGRGVKSIC
jgi:hypothetical protein